MRRRLLLVEDDEVFLRPLHRTLELKGYEVLPAQSGEEALDALRSEDVDLVLTDRRLAGMDGIELVRQIKAEHPDLAVVVMTAYGTIESAVEAMRLGAEDYLVKPFKAAELLLRTHGIDGRSRRQAAADSGDISKLSDEAVAVNAIRQLVARPEMREIIRRELAAFDVAAASVTATQTGENEWTVENE